MMADIGGEFTSDRFRVDFVRNFSRMGQGREK